MQEFPLELIHAIVENISSPTDLFHLRCVNRTYRELVTPVVFRKLRVKSSIQSAQHFQQLIGTATLAFHVREVVYDTRDDVLFRFPLDNVDHIDFEFTELEEALTEAFCAITALPKLERVELNFWPTFISKSGKEIQETPFWFTSLQLTILHAIHHTMNTSCMTSLSLNNVVVMPAPCYDFISSVTSSPLSHLSLSVVSNTEISAWTGFKDVNGPLGVLLPPSNSSLTSLVLHSPLGPYHSLKTQLSLFHYPSLTRLVLGNIILDHTPSIDGIEAFILRHKDSLRRLELRSCACYVTGSAVNARQWSSIWQQWMADLIVLEELIVGSDSQGYVMLDIDSGNVVHKSIGTVTAEEDLASLRMFQDIVATRRVDHDVVL